MPLLWLSLAFLAGIILADVAVLPVGTWLILSGVALGWAIFAIIIQRLRRSRSYGQDTPSPWVILTPLILLALALGAARYQGSLPDLSDPGFIAAHNDTGERVSIIGVVDAFPDLRDRSLYLRLRTEDIRPYGTTTRHQAVDGLLLVRLEPGEVFHYGDRLLLHGYLETPPDPSSSLETGPEGFSYKDYLARQGVYSYMQSERATRLESGQGNPFWGAVYIIKEGALKTVYQLWPDPEASLFAGILLGVEAGIPEPVEDAFRETGTTHIIAISGFNMAVVAGLFVMGFGGLLGPRKGALAALIGLVLYTALVGADPAVVRAAVMAGLALFARQVGRRQQAMLTMAFTAALMALVNPQVPWDIGFQLSFAATLGLVLFAGPMQAGVTNLLSRRVAGPIARRVAAPLSEYFLFTFAAQITTLPIIAYYFGSISWIAFLANPAILPAQPPIMTLGSLALFLGFIWLPLGRLAAPLAWPFVLYTIRAVEFFAGFPGGMRHLGEFSLFWVLLYFVILLGLTFGWERIASWLAARRENRLQGVAVPVIIFLGIAAVIVWRMAFTAPDGRLHLTFLDVGSGEAILVRTPSGRTILVDGGPSASRLSDGLGRRLPPFQKELDWLVVASPRPQGVAALPAVLERFPPANVLWAGLSSPAYQTDNLRQTLAKMDLVARDALPGQELDLGDGAVLKVLAVSDRGAILLLEWDQFRALLPCGADLEAQQILRMGVDIGQVSVLLLADQGYAPLNSPEWINSLRPQLALLSVASGDRDGRPDRETLDALGGYSLLRTDHNGWVQISTDGQHMWVAVEKR